MNKFLSQIEKKAGIEGALRFGSVMGRRTARQVAGKARDFGTAMMGDAGKVGAQFASLRTGKAHLEGTRFSTPIGTVTRGHAMRELASNKAVQGATGVMAAGAAGGYALGRQQEKQACMDKLLEQGFDFDTAVALIKQAEQELYGDKEGK